MQRIRYLKISRICVYQTVSIFIETFDKDKRNSFIFAQEKTFHDRRIRRPVSVCN